MERNELLKYAKVLYECHLTSDALKNELAIAFPELRKSEDESIRGAIIDHLKDYNLTEWAAWLEKQGEQHISCSEEQIKVLDEVLTFAANHESTYWNEYIFGTLCDLIRQLKKQKHKVMKELSIEQKARNYDEALERARKEYKNYEAFNSFREMLVRIFPELKNSKENNDE